MTRHQCGRLDTCTIIFTVLSRFQSYLTTIIIDFVRVDNPKQRHYNLQHRRGMVLNQWCTYLNLAAKNRVMPRLKIGAFRLHDDEPVNNHGVDYDMMLECKKKELALIKYRKHFRKHGGCKHWQYRKSDTLLRQ